MKIVFTPNIVRKANSKVNLQRRRRRKTYYLQKVTDLENQTVIKKITKHDVNY